MCLEQQTPLMPHRPLPHIGLIYMRLDVKTSSLKRRNQINRRSLSRVFRPGPSYAPCPSLGGPAYCRSNNPFAKPGTRHPVPYPDGRYTLTQTLTQSLTLVADLPRAGVVHTVNTVNDQSSYVATLPTPTRNSRHFTWHVDGERAGNETKFINDPKGTVNTANAVYALC